MSSHSFMNRELGVDVSRWQGRTGMPQENWGLLAGEARAFAIIKATGEADHVDPAWQTNVERAASVKMISGVYHFANNRLSTATDQAKLFLTARSAMTSGHLRPAVDYRNHAGLNQQACTDWILAFAAEIKSATGLEPIIYTEFFPGREVPLDDRVREMSLWIKGWTGDPTGEPLTTGPFRDWAVWQYGVAPAGGMKELDLNVIHTEVTPLTSLMI